MRSPQRGEWPAVPGRAGRSFWESSELTVQVGWEVGAEWRKLTCGCRGPEPGGGCWHDWRGVGMGGGGLGTVPATSKVQWKTSERSFP